MAFVLSLHCLPITLFTVFNVRMDLTETNEQIFFSGQIEKLKLRYKALLVQGIEFSGKDSVKPSLLFPSSFECLLSKTDF